MLRKGYLAGFVPQLERGPFPVVVFEGAVEVVSSTGYSSIIVSGSSLPFLHRGIEVICRWGLDIFGNALRTLHANRSPGGGSCLGAATELDAGGGGGICAKIPEVCQTVSYFCVGGYGWRWW